MCIFHIENYTENRGIVRGERRGKKTNGKLHCNYYDKLRDVITRCIFLRVYKYIRQLPIVFERRRL